MKFLRVLCVLALALCVSASVYAETQSVKVSGDLTVRSIYRSSYDMESSPNENVSSGRPGYDSNHQSWLMSIAAIQVDADLTDNVQTVIRVLNQRDWNVYGLGSYAYTTGGTPITSSSVLNPNGRGIYVANDNEFNVMLDLAYVTLKDFIYSPLTVTIGRQDLWFGKGFIIGGNQQNPGMTTSTIQTLTAMNNPNLVVPGNLSAPEYTAINSFDSVKAVLDYDPWTITGIYSKIYEDTIGDRDDVNLWGVNVGYKFNSYKAEAEAYWFWKQDRSIPLWSADPKNTDNDVHTFGIRGSVDPIDIVTLAGELAYQGGSYVGVQTQQAAIARSAWALDVSGEVRYFTDKCAWKPKLGAEYVLYSGADPVSSTQDPGGYRQDDKVYTGWDPMYRGKFDSAIREFVGKFYQTVRYPQVAAGTLSSPDDSRTNQSQLIFSGSVQPIESLTLKANYNLFWNLRPYLGDTSVNNENKSQGFVGQEIDLQANWDYTEDVSFGILAGWFLPGEVYDYNGYKANVASDLVGTVKVSF